ncbi:MAG: class I SAM-dependent methyltransferase [Bryobacteraceae bacterium]
MNPNWCETFFDGLALDLWRAAVTNETTRHETDYILAQLEAAPGARLLDVPCGNGRHSIEAAGRGYRVTGVDLSRGFHEEARARSNAVDWVLGDMRRIGYDGAFDGAWCWGNSFGYFPHAQCIDFLASLARALKPGGRLILETGAVIDTLLPALQPERQMRVGDIDFSSVNHYDVLDGRLDITYTFERGGDREEKPTSLWLHSAAELMRMLRAAGLDPVYAAGGIEGEPFERGSPRMIVTARKL